MKKKDKILICFHLCISLTDSPFFQFDPVYDLQHDTHLQVIFICLSRFNNLCDFQYLPMERDDKNKLASIYPEVYFNKLVASDWIEKTPPLFLPPAVFSRMDSPQDYQVVVFSFESLIILDFLVSIVPRKCILKKT